MILILSLAIPALVLLIARVCYCWGVSVGYHQSTQDQRVANIRKLHDSWRAGMLAERMRQFSPKSVSKN